jgi:hypothetical protein
MFLVAPLQMFATVSVTVNPSSVNMITNGKQQLTAIVTGASDTSVIWTVHEGAAGGSVTGAGLYSAPGSVGIYHVTATSNADPAKSATATIGVPGFVQTGLLYPGPTMSSLLPNGTILFTGGGSTNGTPTANAEIYDPVTAKSTTTGSMTINRGFGTATVLASGKVLFAGGESAGQTATADIYDPATGTFTATGSMSVARVNHTATPLPNGTVLITGGGNCNSGCVNFNTAELYDPTSGTFSRTTGNMVVSHSSAQAVLLPTGKVLIMGGTLSSTDSTGTNFAELYDPSTGLFSATGNMITGRQQSFTATSLQNGNVLVAGGVSSGVSVAHAEVYNISTGTFSATGNLQQPLDGHSATLLPNGQVLIAGGVTTTSLITTAEVYDPVAGTFKATGSLEEPRFSPLAIPLGNGKILITGGSSGANLGGIEIYDPGTGTFSSTSTFMNFSRAGGTMTKLADGRFLFVGGLGGDGNFVLSAEIFDPATNKFTLTGAIATGRQMHTATLLGNGTVLVVGGFTNSSQTGYVSSAEIYDPVSGTFGATPSNPNVTRANHTATLLPNGKVLIAGGLFSSAPLGTPSAELYDPVAGTFTSTGNMSAPRTGHTATPLSDGRILIAEGIYTATPGTYAPDELYDFNTGSFIQLGTPINYNIFNPRPSPFDSVQWPNGQVLVDSSTILDPVSLTLSKFNTSFSIQSSYRFALLPSDQIFVAGTANLVDTETFLLNPNPPLLPQQVQTYLIAGNLRYVRSSPSLALLPNTGSANWNFASVVVSDTADFSTSNNCTSNLDNLSQGASCSVSITFNPTTLGNISASAVITSNQAIPYTIPLSGTGANFSLAAASGSSTSATVAAGQTATFQLTLAPQSLSGSVTLTCAPVTAIPNATCSVSPNPATVSGSSPTVVTVSAVTMAHSGLGMPIASFKWPNSPLWAFVAAHWVFYLLAFLGIVLAAFGPRRAPIAAAAALLLVALAVGCGSSSVSSGGGSTGTGGTTAGSYQLLVTASSAGASRTITLNLTVQ